MRDLHDERGSIVQPACAAECCMVWLPHGGRRTPRVWPIVLANPPGIVPGAAAVVTGL